MRQRDAFISTLFERAKKDKDIYLISVDMGAPSLDAWRDELPEQFFAAGISEQHAINFASGLASRGKKVYVYFMASWAARCFEQIRYSCALPNNPITVLGNGVALGYAPAGPAHEPNEDIAYMRSLCGIEVISPTNSAMASKVVDLTLSEPKLRYIRLERSHPSVLNNVYDGVSLDSDFLNKGHALLSGDLKAEVCILSSGYMLGRALSVCEKLKANNINASVLDVFKIKPLDAKSLKSVVNSYSSIVTLEEQTLSGGFGSAICEALVDAKHMVSTLRLGLPEKYIFENGSREHLLDTHGLSEEAIFENIFNFLKGR